MERCGHKWLAPYKRQPPERDTWREQECVLMKGHVGVHRSMHNVITENRETSNRDSEASS